MFLDRRRDWSEGRGVDEKYIPRAAIGGEIFWLDALPVINHC